MTADDLDTEALLDRAAEGDVDARRWLLDRHRDRLRRMVAVRIDRRLSSRVDPSDVVQEAMTDAAVALDSYLQGRPMAFYPWLRQLAWERLVLLRRHHLGAEKRSVGREVSGGMPLPDESAVLLADRLVAKGSAPVNALIREEMRLRVRSALDELPDRDREVLILRYLEGLRNAEVAEVLGIAEGAVRVRHVRALARLRLRLDGELQENSP
jgi:RNA polymerase sigma-70 factor (ECF subfamily)